MLTMIENLTTLKSLRVSIQMKISHYAYLTEILNVTGMKIQLLLFFISCLFFSLFVVFILYIIIYIFWYNILNTCIILL